MRSFDVLLAQQKGPTAVRRRLGEIYLEDLPEVVDNPDSNRQGEVDMSISDNGCTHAAGEEYLLQLWSTQLNHPHLDTHADFFEAGGSSMQVIEMLMTVSDKYGKEIDFAEFLKCPCIHRLVDLLEN